MLYSTSETWKIIIFEDIFTSILYSRKVPALVKCPLSWFSWLHMLVLYLKTSKLSGFLIFWLHCMSVPDEGVQLDIYVDLQYCFKHNIYMYLATSRTHHFTFAGWGWDGCRAIYFHPHHTLTRVVLLVY